MHRDRRSGRRPRIDVPGALLIGAGSFALIFGLSEGSIYGWWEPLKDVVIGNAAVWPATRAVSIIPFAFAFAIVALTAFVVLERDKERRNADPLFEFGQLRHLGFRYGLLTTMVLAMGQFGLLFVIPVLLQSGARFSALRTGLWMLPLGVTIVLAAPLGARFTRVVGTTSVVRVGLVLEAVGLLWVALTIAPQPSFPALAPGFIVFGLGVGLASSQLTNVILSDIDPDKVGVASGANTTVRQVGLALGIATFAALLNVLTINRGTSAIKAASAFSPAFKADAVDRLHTAGVNFSPPADSSRAAVVTFRRIIDGAVTDGARPALMFAAGVVTIGVCLSFLIPNVGPIREAAPDSVTAEAAEAAEALENLDFA
jgi:hypothetical protein